MPEDAADVLRIYCVCGQKMRATPEMQGKPGKCVACRQRVKIPRLDELPEGCREIHLKDHPEFLRRRASKPVPPEAPKPVAETSPAKGAARDLHSRPTEFRSKSGAAAGTPGHAPRIPLDVLEAVRELCSFDYAIRKRSQAIEEGAVSADSHPDPSALARYAAMVRVAREQVNGRLQHALAEASARLEEIGEALAAALVGARLGTTPYETYAAQVLCLREEREQLERACHNLEAWIETEDPYVAGGPLPVRFEDVPCGDVFVDFPAPVSVEPGALPFTVQQLSAAYIGLAACEQAVRQHRRGAQAAGTAESLGDAPQCDVAARERENAMIAFCRARLRVLAHDTADDLKVIESQLAAARAQYQKGGANTALYHRQEISLLHAQKDLRRAEDVARRALAARHAREVPALQHVTFLQRLARPQTGGAGAGKDSWGLWMAGALLVFDMAMPLSAARHGGPEQFLLSMTVALFVVAMALAAVGALHSARLRALLTMGLWPVMVLAGVVGVRVLQLGGDAIGVQLRNGWAACSYPGLLAYGGALVLAWLAGVWAFGAWGRGRAVPYAVGLLTVGLASVLYLDPAGFWTAQPVLSQAETAVPPDGEPGGFYVLFDVRNEGGQPCTFGGTHPQYANAAQVLIEKRSASGKWEAAGELEAVQTSVGTPWRAPADLSAWTLRPRDEAKLRFLTGAGDFRARLISFMPLRQESLVPFSVVAPEPEPEPEMPDEDAPADETEEAVTPSEAREGVKEPAPVAGVQVLLQGVYGSEERGYTLRFEVTEPGGDPSAVSVSLGDKVYKDWRASEYSESKHRVTLHKDDRYLVLGTGDSVTLPGG